MIEYLKSYQAVMRTVGPVFVGNGREIIKKEYIFAQDRETVEIPDMQRLYAEFRKRGREAAFEEYLLGDGRMGLKEWLDGQGISGEELKPFLKYTLDCRDTVIEKGSKMQIMECIKDGHGKPYLPGSSLKGMFRTVLLGADAGLSPKQSCTRRTEGRRGSPLQNRCLTTLFRTGQSGSTDTIRTRCTARRRTR